MEGGPLFITLYLLAVVVLVFLNGFFVAAEFAMVKVRTSRLESLASEGHLRARYSLRILGSLNAYLSACQLGITFASLALGWIGEPAIVKLLKPLLSSFLPDFAIHTIAIIIAFSIITTLHITVGEQVPKTYAIRHAESMTLWAAIPMVIFYKLMFPFIWMLNGLSNWILRRAGVEPEGQTEAAHTDEEIREIMQESHKSGYLDNTEIALMDNIFEFSETQAREIMIPRTEMVCLYANMPFEQTRAMVIEELHTRYPVCDPDKDNIIGFVHIKDFLKAGEELDDIRSVLRPILTVPESVPISSLLKQMQKERTALALLIDEYGGTSGLVTVEDILEEIVGEIHDEFDEDVQAIEQLDEWTYSVDGLLLIDEFNEHFGTDIPTVDFDTIGGWVYAQVAMPPQTEQCVTCGEYELTIESVDHMRVSRLTVRKTEIGEDGELQVVS